MEKTITIANKRLRIRASAAVPIIYKNQFGSEYTDDVKNAHDELVYMETALRLLWSMARSADSTTPPPEEFIEKYACEDIMAALEEASSLFETSCGCVTAPQTSDREPFSAESLAAKALLCSMPPDYLNEISLSTAMNIIEYYAAAKCGEEMPVEATQKEFDDF